MTTKSSTEQAAEFIAMTSPQAFEVNFCDDRPPTVRSTYDESARDWVIATSPEHLLELLHKARRDYEEVLKKWISDSY